MPPRVAPTRSRLGEAPDIDVGIGLLLEPDDDGRIRREPHRAAAPNEDTVPTLVSRPTARPSPSGRSGALIFLLTTGAMLGASTTLARLAATAGLPPLAFLAWSCAAAAVLSLVRAAIRGTLPPLSARTGEYFLCAAFFTVAAPNLILFSAVAHVGAAFVAMTIALPALLTYVGALAFGLERFRARRVAGVVLALAGTAGIALLEIAVPRAPVGSTPITRHAGCTRANAEAMPAINPPPPTGTITASRSGTSSASSSPTQAVPSTVCTPSKGCTSTRPSSARIRSTMPVSSATFSPNTTVAPSSRQRATRNGLALRGITTVTGTPSVPLAQALAMAWLPAEKATTPASSAPGSRECASSSVLSAPRGLKLPPRCRSSSLTNEADGVGEDTAPGHGTVGVRRTCGASRSATSRRRESSGVAITGAGSGGGRAPARIARFVPTALAERHGPGGEGVLVVRPTSVAVGSSPV